MIFSFLPKVWVGFRSDVTTKQEGGTGYFGEGTRTPWSHRVKMKKELKVKNMEQNSV